MKKKRRLFKKLKVVKTSFFWLYFVLGGIFIITALLFAPFWLEISADIPWASWSAYALGIIVGLLILLYIFTVLIKRMKAEGLKKTPRIVMCVEFGLMAVFSVCAILKGVLYDNEKFNFFNTCEILAIIVWVRGVVEIINAYYHDHDPSSPAKYPIWFLLLNIFLISVGPLLFVVGVRHASKIDEIVSYAISAGLLFLGAFFCVYGGLCKPIKIKETPVTHDLDMLDLKEVKEIENKEEIKEIETKEEVKEIEDNKENEIIDIEQKTTE